MNKEYTSLKRVLEVCTLAKKKKGGKKMTTLTLNQIETRAKSNSSRMQSNINSFENQLKQRNLKKGRVRPKDPTEAKILSFFKRK